MNTTTVEVPTNLGRALDEMAERTGRPLADLVQEALREYLLRRDPPQEDPDFPRSIGMGESDLQAADIDEWLAANWRPADDWGRS